MDYTHKLPAHLGAWPCKILDTAANNGYGQMLVLVEYQVTGDGGIVSMPHRLYVLAADLTRIVPAEPTTPYLVGADGHVYERGTESGTGERLWRKSRGQLGPVMTWAELSDVWVQTGETKPVVPLTPVQDVPDVALPFVMKTSDNDAVSVEAGDPRTGGGVKLTLADNWTWCEADEAEQIAWALLAAVRQVRGETRIYPAGTFFKSPAAPQEAKPL